MKRIEIKRNDQKITEVEYNPQKYTITYENYEGWFILTRNKDKKVIFIFDNGVDFIVEYDKENKTDFIVGSHNLYHEMKINHYVDTYRDCLELIRSFNSQFDSLSECRVGKECFLVDSDLYGGKLYNLDRISKKYSYVYPDKIYDPKGILVSEKIVSKYNQRNYDNITYMVDYDKYEISSPYIYSEKQDKEISLYNRKKIYEMNCHDIEQLEKLKGCSIDEIKLFDITVYCEIIKYLNNLPRKKNAKKEYVKTKKYNNTKGL